MERIYRLDFHEKKQHFHLDNFTHEPDMYGWVVIKEHCTDLEYRIFESYINRDGNVNKKIYCERFIEESF